MAMKFPTGKPVAHQDNQAVVSNANLSMLDLDEARRKLKKFKAELDAIQGLADALVVEDEASAKRAVEIGTRVKRFIKQFEEKRKEIIKEPDQFVRKVNAFVKPFRDDAAKIERTCKNKHSSYMYKKELERREQEQKAREAARKLQEDLDKEAEEKGLDPVKMPAPVVNQSEPTITRTEDGASGSIRKEWKLKEVIDFSQVPDQYKQLNEKAVNAAIKAGVLEIPGLVIEEVPISVFRG